MSNCCCEKNNTNQTARYMADLAKLPALRLQKEPVNHLHELYSRYPDGGEFGWYAFVISDKTFAYWDIEGKRWALISARDLQSVLGIKQEELKAGDMPVWDGENEKFVIVNMSVWGTEEY